ncbi:hypothetical protein EDD21DRAFT_391335 [Dissophora ornata]|nr:hypothetical protein EDD21DRAFT_391335 [Dissophora ornata]
MITRTAASFPKCCFSLKQICVAVTERVPCQRRMSRFNAHEYSRPEQMVGVPVAAEEEGEIVEVEEEVVLVVVEVELGMELAKQEISFKETISCATAVAAADDDEDDDNVDSDRDAYVRVADADDSGGVCGGVAGHDAAEPAGRGGAAAAEAEAAAAAPNKSANSGNAVANRRCAAITGIGEVGEAEGERERLVGLWWWWWSELDRQGIESEMVDRRLLVGVLVTAERDAVRVSAASADDDEDDDIDRGKASAAEVVATVKSTTTFSRSKLSLDSLRQLLSRERIHSWLWRCMCRFVWFSLLRRGKED